MADPLQNLSLLLDTSQQEIMLKLEVQRLHLDLQTAKALNQKYESTIASLLVSSKSTKTGLCPHCKKPVENLLPSELGAAPVDVPPLNSLDSHEARNVLNNPKLPTSPFQFSKNTSTTPAILKSGSENSQATRDVNSTSPSRSQGLSRPDASHLVFPRTLKGKNSPLRSLASGSASSSAARTTQIQPVPKTRTTLASIPPAIPSNQDPTNWSIRINEKVKPSLKVAFKSAIAFDGEVASVSFNPTGEFIAVGVNGFGLDTDWKVYICDVNTGTKKMFLADVNFKDSKPLWRLCFSQNDQHLAVMGSDRIIRIWDFRKRHVRNIFKGHTDVVTSAGFSPDGRFLASSSEDGTVRIWSIRDGFSHVLDKITSRFCHIRFSPNGTRIAAAGEDGILRIWNARTRHLVKKWRAHDGLYRLVFTPDGRNLVTGGSDGKVKRWDISLLGQNEKGETQVQHLEEKEILKYTSQSGTGDHIWWIDVSPDGRWISSGSRDRQVIEIWDAEGLILQCSLKGHKKEIMAVAFSPTTQYLAAGSKDKHISLWSYYAPA